MKIEILFSKLCNLYGDSGNIEYLKLSVPDAEFIMTEITDPVPYFAGNDVDMLYMGSMSEAAQKRVTEYLMPYRDRLEALTDKGVVILATGNAFEVFLSEIQNLTSGEHFRALGLFPLTAQIDLFKRYNGKVMGRIDGITVVGFKSQFSMVYGDASDCFLFKADRGTGLNTSTALEGVRRNNLMGANLLGPVLVLNPLFTEYIMGLLGIDKPRCAFREQAMAAYEQRLSEFEDKAVPFDRQ
ncbi:MAG: hypothetical protein HUJ66_00615 [Oscillospiraceae bacterium]|nr:hypothetical protein [Oscillospiraceae bacterium]